MHYQSHDTEKEFEPRIIPKPATKLDCFVEPTVPEVSLIFEKPTASTARNLSDASPNPSPTRSVRLARVSDNTLECTSSTSPVIRNPNSYAAWREQNYSRDINSKSTKHILPLHKNAHSCNHALQSDLQDISMQKQQEQNKICDTQDMVINVRANERMYEKSVKFRTPNIEDSYDFERRAHLSSCDTKHLSCNSLQRATCIVTDHTTRVPSKVIPDTLKKTEHFQIPCNGYQQLHASGYSSCNVDNNETVKTLLQLVNSQSEQIKNLQLQIDRLVRMQEESFRNKPTYVYPPSIANQEFRHPSINCYDAVLGSSRAQYQNQGTKKNTASQNISVTEKKDLESFNENNKLETALLEQQSRKAFMEQKVSIGVMTSFEFTVQNSPFVVDSEMYEKKEAQHRESSNINRRDALNEQDMTEPIKRYKNTFTRKPGTAQLENIVEDSESYLSSSQQQSSNLNTSSSVKDLERHTLKQADLCNTANTSESLKTYPAYRHHPVYLNQEKIHKGSDNVDEQMENTRKISNASMNVACSPTESTNCSKAITIRDVNHYARIDGEKSIDKMNTNNHSLHNIHLPADYYYNHRNKEYCANTKQMKDVSDSMVLSEGELKVHERPPPTPEPSIHVEMQEYTSDDESDKLKHTSKIGWTFYNNVLGQVNEILQNSSITEDKNQNNAKIIRKVEQENDVETRTALNNVKATTLEQLRRLGISLTENNEHREPNGNKTLDFDSSFYPRLDCQANMIHTTSVVNETNTSMHMKALALKYLSDEQLADIALQKQESSSLKQFMVSNMQGPNMSLATMRYLERYQLLPGKNNIQTEDTDQMYGEITSKHDFKSAAGKNNHTLRRFPFVNTSGTTCPSRILDLSALKRQPKLL